MFRRFVAVFCSLPCQAERTEITISVGGYEDFTLKGTVITEPGWTKYDDYSSKDKLLPPLKKGRPRKYSVRAERKGDLSAEALYDRNAE